MRRSNRSEKAATTVSTEKEWYDENGVQVFPEPRDWCARVLGEDKVCGHMFDDHHDGEDILNDEGTSLAERANRDGGDCKAFHFVDGIDCPCPGFVPRPPDPRAKLERKSIAVADTEGVRP